jgi:predicted transcriptional regulator
MSDVLELETRKKIFECIEKNPGINLSTIAELLHMNVQLVDYHLMFLKNNEIITMEKEDMFKRCYIKGCIGVEDKRMINILRQKMAVQIILFLLKNPYSRHGDMVKHFEMSSPRFTYHLRKLVNAAIVEMSELGAEKGYIVKNEKNIVAFLIRYKPSSIANMVNDTWEDFGPR